MSSVRVLVTCRQMQNCMDHFASRFEERGIEVVQPEVIQQPTEDDLAAIIGGFDGMIAGDDPLSAGVLSKATRMKIISKWGVGTDGIDQGAAARLGIEVTNTPNVFGEEVADVALGYVVMLARQLHRLDASVRSGGWLKVEGQTLSGLTMGIVGFGSIGQAVSRRALGFGMRVVAQDVTDDARSAAQSLGVASVRLDELLRAADYVVLCCPLTPDTRHLMNAESLGRMRTGARLVNVSRGALVDESALVEALRTGHLSAAALDVFETEPLAPESPLLAFEQCVFGTHNGSNTAEGSLRASALAVDNLLSKLDG